MRFSSDRDRKLLEERYVDNRPLNVLKVLECHAKDVPIAEKDFVREDSAFETVHFVIQPDYILFVEDRGIDRASQTGWLRWIQVKKVEICMFQSNRDDGPTSLAPFAVLVDDPGPTCRALDAAIVQGNHPAESHQRRGKPFLNPSKMRMILLPCRFPLLFGLLNHLVVV